MVFKHDAVYVFRNKMYKNYAAFVNSDDDEPAKSALIPAHYEDDNKYGHKWKIMQYGENLYTVQNVVHDVYARSGINQDGLVGKRWSDESYAELWYIKSSSGADPNYYQVLNERGYYWKMAGQGRGKQIDLVQSSGSDDTLWSVERWPLERSSDDHPSHPELPVHLEHPPPIGDVLRVGVLDFLTAQNPTTEIDIVTILYSDDRDTRDDTTKEFETAFKVPRKSEFNVRGGLIAYDAGPFRGGWSVLKTPLGRSLRDKATETRFYSQDFISGAIRDALDTLEWRKGAAKVFVIYTEEEPIVRDDRETDTNMERELSSRLQEEGVLLIFRAKKQIRDAYCNTTSFFLRLRDSTPLVLLSAQCMMCWICRSASHEIDVKRLVEQDFPSESRIVPFRAKPLVAHQDPESLPPRDWSFDAAMDFQRSLPRDQKKLLELARKDIVYRARLFHTLPFLRHLEMPPYLVLNKADEMKNFCGHFFRKGDTMYSCSTCADRKRQYANFCGRCWKNTTHNGHHATERPAPDDAHVCECGDILNDEEVTGDDCLIHS